MFLSGKENPHIAFHVAKKAAVVHTDSDNLEQTGLDIKIYGLSLPSAV